jgi:hypothetical protein
MEVSGQLYDPVALTPETKRDRTARRNIPEVTNLLGYVWLRKNYAGL